MRILSGHIALKALAKAIATRRSVAFFWPRDGRPRLVDTILTRVIASTLPVTTRKSRTASRSRRGHLGFLAIPKADLIGTTVPGERYRPPFLSEDCCSIPQAVVSK